MICTVTLDLGRHTRHPQLRLRREPVIQRCRRKGFQSESEISEFLFDVITPGFQSPDMWADAVTDLITTDIKVNFTNGKSEIVQVMTSDLEQNGTLDRHNFPVTMVKIIIGEVVTL